MDSVLSFIFFLIVGFYLAGLLGRLLLRRWIVRKQREMEQNGGNPFFRTYTWGAGARPAREERKPEGKITVEQTQAPGRKISREVGDYVEYEEVTVETTIETTDETAASTDTTHEGRNG